MTKVQTSVAPFLWSALILILVGIPGNHIPTVSSWINLLQPDKLIHLGLFAPFSWFWAHFFFLKTANRSKSAFWALIIGMFYAGTTELLQLYVFSGRNANFPDAIADIIGTIIGVVIFRKSRLLGLKA